MNWSEYPLHRSRNYFFDTLEKIMEHYNRKTASDVEKKRIAWDEKPSGDNA